ncbi:MAG TPA: glycoside hydrolase family 6 protein [Marmoricola sp.]|nr:glycoside hydrolase family 6 protein [Marmoricola sp.]HNJ77706.1 glycoside hydrolase family 6 protein [Marmoricola sp.]HNO40416.1 glycoside hydrolase family 6 protein [Marmoricola sp.]
MAKFTSGSGIRVGLVGLLAVLLTSTGLAVGAMVTTSQAAGIQAQVGTQAQHTGISIRKRKGKKAGKAKARRAGKKCRKGKRKACRRGNGVGRHNIVPVRCPVVTSPISPNPINMQEMPIYDGPQDPVNAQYNAATGGQKDLLGRIALTPKVMWIGPKITPAQIGPQITNYIRDSQKGDPNKRIQLALFGLFPRGEDARHIPLTPGEVANYRAWIDAAAAALGQTKALIVLEPDLAVNFKGANPALKMELARYAAMRLSQNKNAAIYLDGSDGDWLTVPEATSMLIQAGIQYVRGFALGATHYADSAQNMAFGEQVSGMLAGCGYPGKHYVVDTSDTGAPFTWKQYYAAHPRGVFDNAEVCTARGQARCITLGQPPTTATGAAHADAFLWFGRPWLFMQAWPFDMGRALAVAATTPYW